MRERVRFLTTAIPYIRAYKKRTFVIKLGGRLCDPGPVLENLAAQVSVLHELGIDVVIVHGGGEQTTAMCERLGINPDIVDGRRVTDAQTLEVAKMMLAGVVNTNILAAMRKHNVPAVGLTGVDGGLITANRRPPQSIKDRETGKSRNVDFGYVGDIQSIDDSVVRTLLDGGYVPVLCSMASGTNGEVFNVNADTVAAELAVHIKAAKLFSLTSVDGIMDRVDDPATLHSQLSVSQLTELMETNTIAGGMRPKVTACLRALAGGVPRVHIINGTSEETLLLEVFTNEGCGTLIVNDNEKIGP
jgi:acetylglutamate kinase